VTAADLSGRQIGTTTWLLKAISLLKEEPKLMSATEMDKELADIKREMEELEMKMRQNKKPRWVYEWPMKMPKVKWPVRELMVMRQRRLLRKWLRYAENLKATEEEMIDHCWPETGKGLDDWDDEEDKLGSLMISRTARWAEK
jgi:hypothetical protein